MLPQPLRTLLPSHPNPHCNAAYSFAASLRIKLMAVYLAEDINATTLQPLYGARIPGVVPDTGAGPEGEISPLQRLRRAWTHAACDPGMPHRARTPDRTSRNSAGLLLTRLSLPLDRRRRLDPRL